MLLGATTTLEKNSNLLHLPCHHWNPNITLCVDNYSTLNSSAPSKFYSQDKGGTMESPLMVELAEIWLVEVVILVYDPPSYSHFVDDGCGAFRKKNIQKPTFPSSTPSLQTSFLPWNTPHLTDPYHSSTSSSTLINLPLFMGSPNNTNLYKYSGSSCTTTSARNGVIRSLTRRAYDSYSPKHLDLELQTVRGLCLLNR